MKYRAGFTLVELVMTMVIIGVLAVVVAPRFFDNDAIKARGFADQVQATLRYAQKTAIAQHRFVCADFTASTITLTTGATAACGTSLSNPAGEASYVLTAPSGISFAAVPANFNFNALGQASALTSIMVNGYATPITVEAETGYVHQ